MSRDNRDSDETNESGFVRTVLSDLFETIADMDERDQHRRTGTGSARSGDTRFDYGFSVGIGPQADRGETDETRPAAADTDHAATVHSMDDGCVVTLDLPDIDPCELSAGVDRSDGALLVGVDGGVIERVGLPRSDLEVGDASFNNGVLDVRLRQRGGKRMSDPESEDEEMAETAEKLDSALDSAPDEEPSQQSGSDSVAFVDDMQRGLRDGLLESLGTGDTESGESGLGEQFGRLLGEMVVRKLIAQVRESRDASSGESAADIADPRELIESDIDGEALSEALGDTVLSEAKDDIEDAQQVAEETGELLETVDLSELPEAIDMSELPEAIDFEEVPAAVANAEPKRAVELRRLASLVEFDDLWDAVDVREFMQNKDELEDAADDVADEDGADDSSLTDSLDSPSLGSDSSAEGESGSFIEQEEAMQAAIQSKLRDAVEEFRESALDARGQLKAARDTAQAQVEEKTGGGTGQPSSRNPTAYSTMVSGWKTGGWSSANFSTVPQGTRHSSAPGHFRIYGRRFENRGDDDE